MVKRLDDKEKQQCSHNAGNSDQNKIRDLMSKKLNQMVFRKNVGCQTDDVQEEEKPHDICNCNKCCFANRESDPAYLCAFDDLHDKCICYEPAHEKVNYHFLIPFVISLSLGVM